MDFRRALVLGIGSASYGSLQQLQERLVALQDVSVIETMALLPDDTTANNAPEGIHTVAIKQLAKTTQPNDIVADAQLGKELYQAFDRIVIATRDPSLIHNGHRVQVAEPLEIFVVVDLAEPLAVSVAAIASMALDAAQRLNSVAQASLILALPNVDSTTMPRIRHAFQQIRKATGDVASAVSYIYIVEPYNAAMQRLKSADALFPMVGDWLFHYLAGEFSAPLHSARSDQVGVTIRTLGCANLHVPIDDVIDVLAQRFDHQAMLNYVLAETAKSDAVLQSGWAQAKITTDALKTELFVGIPSLAIDQHAFSNKPFHRYQELEQELAASYNSRLDQGTVGTTEKIRANRHAILDQIRVRLNGLVTSELDTNDNIGAVRGAVKLCTLYENYLDGAYERSTKRVQTLEQQLGAFDKSIKLTRARFWHRVQAFSRPPFLLPIVSLVIVLAAGVYLAWSVLIGLLAQQAMAILLVVGIVAFATLFALSVYRSIGTAKSELIRQYAKRLELAIDQQKERDQRTLYAQLLVIVRTEYSNHFGQLIQTLSSDLPRSLDVSLPDATIERICGEHGYELEASVFQRATLANDLDALYRDAFGDSIDNELRAFYSETQKLSVRLIQTPTALRDDLRAWVKTRYLGHLHTRPVSTYLTKYSEGVQREMLRKLRDDGRIYSRLDYGLIGQHANEGEIVFLGGAQEDLRSVEALFRNIPQPPQFITTSDPLRLSAVSMARDVPLDALRIMRELSMGSMSASADGPTTIVRQRDPITNRIMDESTTIALGRLLDVLQLRNGQWGFEQENRIVRIIARGNARADLMTFVELGDTISSVGTYLRQPSNAEQFHALQTSVNAALGTYWKDQRPDELSKLIELIFDAREQPKNWDEAEMRALKQYLDTIVDLYYSVNPSSPS